MENSFFFFFFLKISLLEMLIAFGNVPRPIFMEMFGLKVVIENVCP